MSSHTHPTGQSTGPTAGRTTAHTAGHTTVSSPTGPSGPDTSHLEGTRLVSLKMRASLDGRHISGAERIVAETDAARVSGELIARALNHPRAGNDVPDDIRLRAYPVPQEDIIYLPCLTPDYQHCTDPATAESLFAAVAPPQAVATLRNMRDEPGARLVTTSGRVLDRIVRTSTVDAAEFSAASKRPFHEALILATKTAHAPGVVAELCISDDPHYTTGYFANAGRYVRIPNVKEHGSPAGGRVYVIDDAHADGAALEELICYLKHTPVLVTGLPDVPPGP